MKRVPLYEREPEFRVLQLPRWRREGETILVEDKETGLEQSWNLWTAEILTGLAAGERFPALMERLVRAWPDRRPRKRDASLRRFFYTLHRLKAIELVYDQPASFAEGRYQTIKELGRGGVGVAWLCEDTKGGREVVAAAREASEDQDGSRRSVVIKRAWDYFAALERTDALVRAETEVMRRLDHPRIAKAYDTFEENGLLHLVREFVRGDELSRWRGKGIADAAVRRSVARDIADVVAHLHERGYLLLDLRPANFFVDPVDMRAMLIDVGHCKPMVDGVVDLGIPAKGKQHGSPGFAAPETKSIGKATPRTDVWGFGRLYFFLCTGQLPKQGMMTQELLERMDALAVGAEDRRVVADCADDDPPRRPASMRDVAVLLS